MNLRIENGSLYADNIFLCYAGAGNGRPYLPAGNYPVATQYAHVHGKTLADAVGLGWIGATHQCDVVLGGVWGRHGAVPSPTAFNRLLALVEAAEDLGQAVTLEVVR